MHHIFDLHMLYATIPRINIVMNVGMEVPKALKQLAYL